MSTKNGNIDNVPEASCGGKIRKHVSSSSDSDTNPLKPPRHKLKVGMDDSRIIDVITSVQKSLEASITDLKACMDNQIAEQGKFRQSIEQRLSNIEHSVYNKIESECQAVKDEVHMEIAKISDSVRSVESQMTLLQH